MGAFIVFRFNKRKTNVKKNSNCLVGTAILIELRWLRDRLICGLLFSIAWLDALFI